jgi:TolB protein
MAAGTGDGRNPQVRIAVRHWGRPHPLFSSVGAVVTSVVLVCTAGAQQSAGAQQQPSGRVETQAALPAAHRAPAPAVRSYIVVYDVATQVGKVVYQTERHIEAPNWSPDGKYLMVNGDGHLFRLAVHGNGDAVDAPQLIDTGVVTNCNNDHGISHDGKTLAISASVQKSGSQVFLTNADGSGAHLLTPNYPSYFHTFSPDGKWTVYTAERNGNFDIYRLPTGRLPTGRLPTAGTASQPQTTEERLTMSPSFEDGPDYSPDGKWIYVNSTRTGGYDIWRFPSDGAGVGDRLAERITDDALEDWFPHPSPDGKWIVFLSYPAGTKEHPPNLPVQIRLMPAPGDKPGTPDKPHVRSLVRLFGGQGTMNVNSWSPDSTRFAYIRYELVLH